MAFTQADLDNINQLIASGVKQVTFQGRTVTYGDLINIRKEIMSDIVKNSARDTIRYRTTVYSRGL